VDENPGLAPAMASGRSDHPVRQGRKVQDQCVGAVPKAQIQAKLTSRLIPAAAWPASSRSGPRSSGPSRGKRAGPGRQAAPLPARAGPGRGCDLVVFPELALTTFFRAGGWRTRPRSTSSSSGRCPVPETRPSSTSGAARDRVLPGYAELIREGGALRATTPRSSVDRAGRLVGKYRKVHLPGHAEHEPWRPFQHLESGISTWAISAFQSGARWAASSACVSATTGAGRRRIESWATGGRDESCSAITRRRTTHPRRSRTRWAPSTITS